MQMLSKSPVTTNSTNDDNLQHRGMLDIRVGTCIVKLVYACLPLLSYSCAKVIISINNVDVFRGKKIATILCPTDHTRMLSG